MIFTNLFRKKPIMRDFSHRRIVTGHTPEGKAVVAQDEKVAGYVTPTKDAVLTTLWSTDRFPCDNADPRDGKDLTKALVTKNGTVLRFVDMMPHSRSPFHRTQSLDYGIVTHGEVYLELDDGVLVLMKVGDVVIQRGTIHAWVNKSAEPCSIAFVLVDADPVRTDAGPLEPTHMPASVR